MQRDLAQTDFSETTLSTTSLGDLALKNFDEVEPTIKRIAFGFTHNTDDADDFVQEIRLRTYQAYKGPEEIPHFKAWAIRIAVNYGITHSRREKRNSESASLDIEITDECFDSKWLDEDQAEKLISLIDQIPEEEYRQVMKLILVEEMSYQDAAETLNVPIGTIRSRLFRGRTLFKKLFSLDDEGNIIPIRPVFAG